VDDDERDDPALTPTVAPPSPSAIPASAATTVQVNLLPGSPGKPIDPELAEKVFGYMRSDSDNRLTLGMEAERNRAGLLKRRDYQGYSVTVLVLLAVIAFGFLIGTKDIEQAKEYFRMVLAAGGGYGLGRMARRKDED
jgi:hypothetical protein